MKKIVTIILAIIVALGAIYSAIVFVNWDYFKSAEFSPYYTNKFSNPDIVVKYHPVKYYSVFNSRTGERILKNVSLHSSIMEQGDSLLLFSEKEKFGGINTITGEIVFKGIDSEPIFKSEGMIACIKNEKLGFVNPSGELVIDYKYVHPDEYEFNDGYFLNGLCVVKDFNKEERLIDKLGNTVFGPIDGTIEMNDAGVFVKTDDRITQYSFDMEVINRDILYDVSELYLESETTSGVSMEPKMFRYSLEGSKYGLMDCNGKKLTEPIYLCIMPLSDNLIKASYDEYSYSVLLNTKGEIVDINQ
ncbi:MAG: hypothetical protein MJZ16_09695 [Bacteroidales bacterium]|nr:hypothetical protein [Bacteroidales bacterium]